MAVTPEISPLERNIIRQVEYYFGDFNLPRDKFLKECVKENEGWISMETLLKFKRLADLSKEGTVILEALKKSDAGLLEIDGDGEGKVRRCPNLALPENTEEYKKQLEAKTAYAKGYDKEATTMDELLSYYAEHEPAIVNIQMRNYFDKKQNKKMFKGSLFLTFRDEESCKAFVGAESKKYKEGDDLIRKFQADYLEEKRREYEEKKNKKGKKAAKEEAEVKKEEEVEIKEEDKLPKGTVIKLTGLGGDISREDIKEKLKADFEVNIDKESGDIAFITYQIGEPEAKIRFKVADFAVPLVEKMKAAEKIEIKDKTIEASILEGEEEEKFLAESLMDLRSQRNKNKNHKRKNFGGRDGGRGGHKKFKKN